MPSWSSRTTRRCRRSRRNLQVSQGCGHGKPLTLVFPLLECQRQLKDYRENREQLEGFQSQELAKVKHMLLSAETALEKEKKLKEEAQSQKGDEKTVSQLQQKVTNLEKTLAGVEAREAAAVVGHGEEVRRLEERLRVQDLGGDERLEAATKERDELDTALKAANTYLADVKRLLAGKSDECERMAREKSELETEHAEKLAKLMAERDVVKSSLLEMEISTHESKDRLGEEREKTKLEMAKLATEKETLEVTLDRRDKELKQKKEEARTQVAELTRAKEDAEKAVHAKDARIAALEAEVSLMKAKLASSSTSLREVEASEQAAKASMEEMHGRLRKVETELSHNREKLRAAETSSQSYAAEAAQKAKEAIGVQTERDEALRRIVGLEAAVATGEAARSAAESHASAAKDESKRLQAILAENVATFDSRVEASEVVQALRKDLQVANDELTDKRKVSLSFSQWPSLDASRIFFPRWWNCIKGAFRISRRPSRRSCRRPARPRPCPRRPTGRRRTTPSIRNRPVEAPLRRLRLGDELLRHRRLSRRLRWPAQRRQTSLATTK